MGSLIDIYTAAKYNEWANNRLYNALRDLTDEARRKDRRAFFRSIHNTMNHILLADILYRQRLEKKPITVKVGDTVLYGKYAGTELNYDGEDYLIMKESDILAIIG